MSEAITDEDRSLPYVAIGNDELGKPIGALVTCPHCQQPHAVSYGDEVLADGTKVPSKLLGFYKCGEKTYLCAVAGRSVMERFR